MIDVKKILSNYKKYRIEEFSELRFSYDDFFKALNKFDDEKFYKEKIGKSFEDRDLFLLKIGKGEKKVFFWSQMHGNEPISTQGLFDLLNFFNSNDEFDELRQNILQNCTLYFFPLVNPDGNEQFTRRNAQGIDLNRDALKQTAPEAKILNNIIDKIKPDFAFNLHDQERYYGTVNSELPTALSFLTPSFDNEKTIDKYREKSMKLIASVSENLQTYLPNQIAKYNDAFMSVAFGDNVQKKEIPTVLIEAGYIMGDEQRQQVRKYYFLAMLLSLYQISNDIYLKMQLSDYQRILLNVKYKFIDIKLKNVGLIKNGKKFVTDIAIVKNILDTEKFTDLIDEYLIFDIGDLTTKKSFKEINCNEKIFEGKVERLQNARKLIKFYL